MLQGVLTLIIKSFIFCPKYCSIFPHYYYLLFFMNYKFERSLQINIILVLLKEKGENIIIQK